MKKSCKTRLRALAFAFFAVVLIVLVFIINDRASENVCGILGMTILSTIASILGVSAVWELFAKASFAEELLNKVGIKDNIIDSGIQEVFEDFKDIDWRKEFENQKQLTIFFVYGKTWRNNNRQELEKFVKKGKIRLIVPNFNDKQIVDELNKRFSYGKYAQEDTKKTYDVKDLIKDTINDFNKLGAEIFLFNGTLNASYYIMEDICIYAPSKHGKVKGYVPAIKMSTNGKLYSFFERELQAILDISEKLESREEVRKNEEKS